MSNVFRPDFIQIPTQVLTDKSLQPLDRILFGYIYWFTKLKDGQCTASNDTLAELTNSTAYTIKNSLNRLNRSGWITKIMRNNNVRKEIKCNLSYGRDGSLKSNTKVKSNDFTSEIKRFHLEKNQQRKVKSNDNPEEYLKRLVNNIGAPREEPHAPMPKDQLSEAGKRLVARVDAYRQRIKHQGSDNVA